MSHSNRFSPGDISAAAAAIGRPSASDDFRGESRPMHVAAAAVFSLFDAVVNVADSFRRAYAVKSTYRKLAALDDRTLSDIGLQRSELAAVAVHCVDNPAADYRKTAF